MLCIVNRAYEDLIKKFLKVITTNSFKMKVVLVSVILLGLLFIGAFDRVKLVLC